jgi:single-strand DNA-binding protein
MVKLQIIGNLGKDCTTNMVGGRNVINFSVAHTEKYKDSTGMQKEKTLWVECAYWTDKTGIVPYLKKGQTVYAEGTPEIRSYTKNDGSAGASLTMRVLNVQLIGSASRGEVSDANGIPERFPTAASVAPMTAATGVGADDDLPF